MEWNHLRFVVTGTGRSGTGYAAALFNAAGLQCGHEEYFRSTPSVFEMGDMVPLRFGVVRRPYHRVRESLRRRSLDLQGESSWMAVPRLPKVKGVKILLVRHPEMVMRSFLGTGFFTDHSRHRAQRRYALSFFDLTADPALDALRWWVEWNSLALPHVDVVVRLESFDQESFAAILERIGCVTDPSVLAEAAFVAVPGPVNTAADRGHGTGNTSLEDIADGPTLARALDLAEDFGYSL